MKNNIIIDCFAGGGGASVGIEMALGRQVDIAVNHDPQAIRMHSVNHPDTLHLTEDIFKVDLQKYVGGRHVALMWASPDCTHFSKAKGRKPLKKEIRILPMAIVKHAKLLKPDVVIMENVEEIRQWGKLNRKGRPIESEKGKLYRKFLKKMYLAGYLQIETRELVAADYGAPTKRKRWYAIFRRDSKPIKWPDPAYSKQDASLMKWKECGDYIDWSYLGTSIFTRKKALAEATMKRIANGVKKYIIDNPNPYIVRNKEALAFLIQYHGETRSGESRGQLLTEPINTIDTSNRYGLVSAFLIKYYGTGCGQMLNEPLGTITTRDRFGLVNVIIDIDGEKYIIRDIFLRMLNPEELKLMQGFPEDYIIDRDACGKRYPICEQTAKIGNSVSPVMAKMLVEANCPYLREGDRMPNMSIAAEQTGQLRFA